MPVQAPPRWLEAEQLGEVTLVKFNTTKILDQDMVQLIGQQLYQMVDAGTRYIVLDLASVERMTSNMLGKMIGLHKRLQAGGGRLALCRVNPSLSQILKTLRLHLLFKIYASEQEAMQAMPVHV